MSYFLSDWTLANFIKQNTQQKKKEKKERPKFEPKE